MVAFLTIIFLLISCYLALTIGAAFPLIGPSISAILIGAIVRHTPFYEKLDKGVTGFVASYFLKTGIVLLGLTLSMRLVGEVGFTVLLVLAAEVITSISVAVLVNRYFKLGDKLALLIGIGTAICGGSAIMATAPIMEAEDEDIAVSVTTMLIYSMAALLFLPLVGRALGYTDQLYGVLAGAAVNDTASVVATAFEWSDTSGQVATVVKLVRTLFIVPVSLGVIGYRFKQLQDQQATSKQQSAGVNWRDIVGLIPLFVVLFVVAVIIASIFQLPAALTAQISTVSKLFMTLALVTIGLGVHIKQIQAAGIKPVIMGGLCWTGVVAASAIVISLVY
ncbi:hypothetical protein AWM75_00505 [Aerococcus urinaehominis]|uniref:Uncharacterized protein n=1 Tax=Aerococcus urinaehominis TaxID=128944 RepID=A0A0X8FJM7_9LACT|nr:putative sulfate exporter family transporter [Aerococcus urinaehominis]AMB98563.1 hypothetical protein AWM75_00505 [Aerococcus urinaehominis]SDL77838.1 conserved hypothetical integral membrane protein [Aerococcus urinaehominis]